LKKIKIKNIGRETQKKASKRTRATMKKKRENMIWSFYKMI